MALPIIYTKKGEGLTHRVKMTDPNGLDYDLTGSTINAVRFLKHQGGPLLKQYITTDAEITVNATAGEIFIQVADIDLAFGDPRVGDRYAFEIDWTLSGGVRQTLVAGRMIILKEGDASALDTSQTQVVVDPNGKTTEVIVPAADQVKRATEAADAAEAARDQVIADLEKKADKVTTVIAGHFAGLDTNGNLTDSGKNAASFDAAGTAQQTVTDHETNHNHALLDTYTQTEANLADAVAKKHDHANKALLDTYTQTEANLADAVGKKHSQNTDTGTLHANFRLNDDFGGATPTEDGALEVDRGTQPDARLLWKETDDRWYAGLFGTEAKIGLHTDGLSVFSMDIKTDNLPEGTTNLYHTVARVRGALAAAGDLAYDATTGTFSVTTYKKADFDTHFGTKTTDGLAEGTSALYFTNTRARGAVSASGDLTYNATTGVFSVTTYKTANFNTDFGTKKTDDLAEGLTNLYHTAARVRAALSAGGDLTYDSATGTFSVTTYKTSNFNTDFSAKKTDDLAEGLTNLYFTNERVDDRVAALLVASGTVTLTYDDVNGKLTVGESHSARTDNPHAVTAAQTGAVAKAGDTMTGALTLAGDPTQALHAAPKQYVDSIAKGLSDFKDSCKVATVQNHDLSTVGEITVDGVAVVAGDRVLVRAQTDPVQNGIYVVQATNWVRASDANEDSEVTAGMFVFVDQGTYANKGFVLATDNPITLGITGLNFSVFSSAEEITAGTGLSKTGSTLNVTLSGLTTDNLSEGTTNVYWTQGRFDTAFGGKTTDNLAEGTTKLYFTNARARGALSASGDLTYDSVNGIFSVTTYKTANFNTDFSAKTTNDLAEGTTNLYFTNERVDDRVAALITAGARITLAYDDVNGTLTITAADQSIANTDSLPEGTTNLYHTSERVDDRVAALLKAGTHISSITYDDVANTLTINAADQSIANTDSLAEGTTNLYFTNERVDDRVAALLVAGSNTTLTYDDAAGTLTIASTSSVTAMNDLSDVTLTTPADGHILRYNGTAWVNTTPEQAGLAKLAGSDFTGFVKLIGATVTVDGGYNNSPLFTLRGTYDSDGTTAIASSAYDATLQNVMLGASPSSKLAFAFGGTEKASISNTGNATFAGSLSAVGHIEHKAGSAPANPAANAVRTFVRTTGTTPNKTVEFVALFEDGTETILASVIV